MRKSFRGLSGVVRERLNDDPLSGHVFCFVNSRRTLLKLLIYDRTGYWIFYKKLSRGRFHLPAHEAEQKVALNAGQLLLMLEGLDVTSLVRRVRHHHETTSADDN